MFRTTMFIVSMMFLLTVVSCGGGGGTQNTGNTSGQTGRTTTPPPQTVDFNGTSAAELAAKWGGLGEDAAILNDWYENVDGALIDPMEWHVSEIAKGNIDSYTMDLAAGEYMLQGLGGKNLTDLNVKVTVGVPGMETVLGEDTENDNIPIVIFAVDKPETVTIEFDPVAFEGAADKANYSWAIYPKMTDYQGVTVEGLTAKWTELGEDEDALTSWLATDNSVVLAPVQEWYISEIEKDNVDNYTIELTAGEYEIRGLAGTGIIDLDMTAYGADSSGDNDYLDTDTLTDNKPLLSFEVDSDQTVTIKVEAFEFERRAEAGRYCWALYKTSTDSADDESYDYVEE